MTSLEHAPWLRSDAIQKVFRAIEQEGDQARAVGGSVRNTLLNVPVTDVDIATTALPSDVAARAEAAGLKAIPTGIDHGTITIISGGTPYEVTTLRKDVETFGRQAKVVFGTDWTEDARRRDFTLNALYADRNGRIYDPLGGLDDCLAGHVRFIGTAEHRIKEDYLRILRFFRIHAAYGQGRLDQEGLHACIQQRDGLRHLSAERIGMEMKKLVATPLAADCLALMEDSGLLEITTGGVSRIADFRALRSLDEFAEETRHPPLGFAVLSGFVDEDVDRIADRFRLSNTDRKRMHKALAVARATEPQNEGFCAQTTLYHHGRAGAIDGLIWLWAQTRARGGDQAQDAKLAARLKECREAEIPAFPLKGSDLLLNGLKPGPQVGEVMAEMERCWIQSGFILKKTELLKLARQFSLD